MTTTGIIFRHLPEKRVTTFAHGLAGKSGGYLALRTAVRRELGLPHTPDGEQAVTDVLYVRMAKSLALGLPVLDAGTNLRSQYVAESAALMASAGVTAITVVDFFPSHLGAMACVESVERAAGDGHGGIAAEDIRRLARKALHFAFDPVKVIKAVLADDFDGVAVTAITPGAGE